MTDADLRTFLQQECVPIDDDVIELRERITSLLAGGDEALRGARLLLEHGIHSQALNSLEEVSQRYGESLALAYGRKIPDGHGYHWKAAELLRLYCEVHAPTMTRYSRQLQTLRDTRNRVKYGGEIIAEGQLRMLNQVIEGFVPAFRGEPLARLLLIRSTG